MEQIVNKVKNSGLIQLDLADFKPRQEIVTIDLKDNLWEGLVLKEKAFRLFIKENDWTKYSGKVVSIICSADAIVPTWAYMLVVSQLATLGIQSFAADKDQVARELTKANILAFPLNEYQDAKFIIKGCSDIIDPPYVMSELTKHLIKVASSIMYGEPCSTVPVYKRPRG